MNMTRREFLAALGATLALPKSMLADAVSAAGSLPGYYASYLDAIAQKVAEDAAKGAANGFFFFTDPHVAANYCQSGFVIADLVKRTDLKRVVCGGDFSAAFSDGADPKTFVDCLYAKMERLWRDPIEEAGGLLFTAKGNHDMRVWKGRDLKGGWVYSSVHTREMLMATKESANVVQNPDEKTGMYFYRDDDAAKTRYIVADTTDGVCKEDMPDTGRDFGCYMREDQLRWIAEVALGTVPAGFGVVVIQHIPLTPFTGHIKEIGRFEDFRRTLEAYQARGKVETKAGSFDFSSRNGGDIVMDISGHTHSDEFAFYNGILHVSETCDAYYSDPAYRTPFSGRLFKDRKARKGTVMEQAFDVVRFGGGAVRTTRIGPGQDRVFRLKPVVLKTGEKLRLEPPERADAKWCAFDSWDVKENRNEKDPAKYWTFSNEIADVSPDGVLAAKSPGWATAVAIAPDFRKEIVGIQVV